MRTKYSMINMIFGVGGHVLNMVLAFVSRMIWASAACSQTFWAC